MNMKCLLLLLTFMYFIGKYYGTFGCLFHYSE